MIRDRFDDTPRTQGRIGAHRAENPGMNGGVVLLWSAVAVLVLVVAGIFGAMLVMGKISLAPEPAATAAPTPKETGIVDTAYSVMVLNATTATGLATTTRDTIINAGWPATSVVAGDANAQDFATTTIYYVADADRPAALGLSEVLGGVPVVQSDAYAADVAAGGKQLTVVLGLDRAPDAPVDAPEDAPAE